MEDTISKKLTIVFQGFDDILSLHLISKRFLLDLSKLHLQPQQQLQMQLSKLAKYDPFVVDVHEFRQSSMLLCFISSENREYPAPKSCPEFPGGNADGTYFALLDIELGSDGRTNSALPDGMYTAFSKTTSGESSLAVVINRSARSFSSNLWSKFFAKETGNDEYRVYSKFQVCVDLENMYTNYTNHRQGNCRNCALTTPSCRY
jgi:hypothetical protein